MDLETKDEHVRKELSLGFWEQHLTLWIALCIVIGLLIGYFCLIRTVHGFTKICAVINPIGILLLFMMYLTVVKICFSDVKQAARNPKSLIVTIIANWIIAPPLMTFLANSCFAGNPQYTA